MHAYYAIVAFTILFLSSASSLPSVAQLTAPFDHGEGPLWDERVQRLFFVDIHAGDVHSLDPNTPDQLATMHFGNHTDISAVFTVAGDSELFVVAANRSLLAVKWGGGVRDGYRRTVLAEVGGEKVGSRFNDGKVDGSGRIWIGTMGFEDSSGVRPNDGSLYRVCAPSPLTLGKPTLDPTLILSPVNVSNGLAWNSDNTAMYYIDSPSLKVMRYDYDAETGVIDNATVAFDFGADGRFAGVPDGMTIDRSDNLYVALYGGGCVVHINPTTHTVLHIHAVPSRYVTSVTFGGPLYDTLYVTTSRRSLTAEERRWQPSAGAVFAVTGLPTGGLPITHTNVIDTEAMLRLDCRESGSEGDLWCADVVYPKVEGGGKGV